MAATVNITYDYPHGGFEGNGRFSHVWASSQITLNGNYTHAMVFNTVVPKCSHIEVYVFAENVSGNVLGISWDFYVFKANYGWMVAKQFTMSTDGWCTIECDLANINITQFAFVPSISQPSGYQWNTYYSVWEMTVTETLTVNDVSTSTFQYGVFANYYGVDKQLNEVFANVGGTLKRATNILVNIENRLVPITPVYSAYLKTENDIPIVYKFVPDSSGTYKIKNSDVVGRQIIMLFDSGLNSLSEYPFYYNSFALTGGNVYYIAKIHMYSDSYTASESYLQIYKEG